MKNGRGAAGRVAKTLPPRSARGAPALLRTAGTGLFIGFSGPLKCRRDTAARMVQRGTGL
jgi:hypothetical protein